MKRTGRRGVIPEWSFVDLPAESFIRQTHEDGFPNLAKATNDIVDGIRSPPEPRPSGATCSSSPPRPTAA